MPINYLKMARECLDEAAAKESRIEELWQEYRRTGRADVRRHISILEDLRDELLVKAHIYEKRAEKNKIFQGSGKSNE